MCSVAHPCLATRARGAAGSRTGTCQNRSLCAPLKPRQMIRYSKQYWGVLTLARWYGSAFPRALPFSLLSAAIAGCLQAFYAEALRAEWTHPYPFQAFAFIAGFMIVFRCEARCLMLTMSVASEKG